MPMSTSAVLDALGAALEGIAGLQVRDYMADAIVPPAAMLGIQNIEYDFTFARGSDQGIFLVYVLVGKASDRSARDKLDAYLAASGASSVKAALEADVTLGGACQTLRVQSAQVSTPHRPISVGGIEYLAAIFTVDVIA